MKRFFRMGTIIVCVIISTSLTSQDVEVINPHDFEINIEDFPSDRVINHIEGWGGMTVAVNNVPAGTDFSPLLEGLKNNSCQVPHWGYIFKGVLRLTYDDGREITLKAGDLFYMPPGHTAYVEEDLKIMDFSPDKKFKRLVDHIDKKIAASEE